MSTYMADDRRRVFLTQHGYSADIIRLTDLPMLEDEYWRPQQVYGGLRAMRDFYKEGRKGTPLHLILPGVWLMSASCGAWDNKRMFDNGTDDDTWEPTV